MSSTQHQKTLDFLNSLISEGQHEMAADLLDGEIDGLKPAQLYTTVSLRAAGQGRLPSTRTMPLAFAANGGVMHRGDLSMRHDMRPPPTKTERLQLYRAHMRRDRNRIPFGPTSAIARSAAAIEDSLPDDHPLRLARGRNENDRLAIRSEIRWLKGYKQHLKEKSSGKVLRDYAATAPPWVAVDKTTGILHPDYDKVTIAPYWAWKDTQGAAVTPNSLDFSMDAMHGETPAPLVPSDPANRKTNTTGDRAAAEKYGSLLGYGPRDGQLGDRWKTGTHFTHVALRGSALEYHLLRAMKHLERLQQMKEPDGAPTHPGVESAIAQIKNDLSGNVGAKSFIDTEYGKKVLGDMFREGTVGGAPEKANDQPFGVSGNAGKRLKLDFALHKLLASAGASKGISVDKALDRLFRSDKPDDYYHKTVAALAGHADLQPHLAALGKNGASGEVAKSLYRLATHAADRHMRDIEGHAAAHDFFETAATANHAAYQKRTGTGTKTQNPLKLARHPDRRPKGFFEGKPGVTAHVFKSTDPSWWTKVVPLVYHHWIPKRLAETGGYKVITTHPDWPRSMLHQFGTEKEALAHAMAHVNGEEPENTALRLARTEILPWHTAVYHALRPEGINEIRKLVVHGARDPKRPAARKLEELKLLVNRLMHGTPGAAEHAVPLLNSSWKEFLPFLKMLGRDGGSETGVAPATPPPVSPSTLVHDEHGPVMHNAPAENSPLSDRLFWAAQSVEHPTRAPLLTRVASQLLASGHPVQHDITSDRKIHSVLSDVAEGKYKHEKITPLLQTEKLHLSPTELRDVVSEKLRHISDSDKGHQLQEKLRITHES